MKKNVLYTSAVSIMMASVIALCSACSAQTPPAAENEETPAGSTANNEVIDESAVIVPGADTDMQTETDPNAAADSEQKTPDSSVTEPEADSSSAAVPETDGSFVRAQITFESKEDSDSAQDGTLLYTSLCSYPVVQIEGNEGATEKINADIRAKVDAVLADTATRDYARNDYQSRQEYLLENEDEYGFSNYYHDLDITVTRNDSNVISFLIADSVYSGGVHGNYVFTGLNYDAETGDAIAFADLAENAGSFHEDTLAFLQELIVTDTYQAVLFENASEDLETTLYQESSWYLSTDGLVFFSNPYALGPFSSGMIEFIIPYDKLSEMGFRQAYAYQGNLTVKLQSEEPYFLDLNGDGQDESIRFYIEDIGTLDAKPHLIINDTDFARENEELLALFSDGEYSYYWAKCYLYDMDAADNTIEIAVYMEHAYNIDTEESLGSTFFYRYDGNGTLSSAGMTRGSIADPMTELPGQ